MAENPWSVPEGRQIGLPVAFQCDRQHPITGQACRSAGHVTPEHSWGLSPTSVVLCGSMTYFELMLAEAARLTEQDLIVLLPVPVRPEFPRRQLEALYRRKIAACDAVHVMNVHGQLGRSTAAELEHARALGKPVTFYEPDSAPALDQLDLPAEVGTGADTAVRTLLRRPPSPGVHGSVWPTVDRLHQAHLAAAGPALNLADVLRGVVDGGRGAFVGGGGWVDNIAVDRLEAVVHAAEHGYQLCPRPGAYGARCWLPAEHCDDCLTDHGWLWSLAYGRRHAPALEVCTRCTPGRRAPAPARCPHRTRPA